MKELQQDEFINPDRILNLNVSKEELEKDFQEIKKSMERLTSLETKIISKIIEINNLRNEQNNNQ